VWGDLAERLDRDDFLYAHIKNLRKKLAAQGCDGLIKTVYGLGYRMSERA
ncbi:MAG: helix-turn-helix domain-containing protein, partial [Flavobacteriales bacterium]|nr:helix-turn-helix domain-containing protein [Flavobacteriales bacterium]